MNWLAAWAMMPEWTLILIKFSALIIMCWIANILILHWHPAARVTALRISLLAVISYPFVVLLVPEYTYRVELPSDAGVGKRAFAAVQPDRASEDVPARAVSSESAFPLQGAPPVESQFDWRLGLLGIWITGAIVFLSRTIAAIAATERCARSGHLADAALLNHVGVLARRIGLHSTPRIQIAEGGPAIAGIWSPVIIVPETKGTSGNLTAVLLHECAHLKQRDLQWSVVFEFACALAWFYPMLWHMARIHRQACEEACDETAARALGSASDYRRALAQVALHHSQIRLALPMARRSHLVARLRKLTLQAPAHPNRVQVISISTAFLLLFACSAVFSSGIAGDEAAYEKAPSTTANEFTLGPTQFTIDKVVRWNIGGQPLVEDGDGNPFAAAWNGASPDKQILDAVDIASIQIGPVADVFDITELRVFDHATRTLLNSGRPNAAGYRLVGRTIQLMCIQGSLPPSLDIWLRVRHRPSDPDAVLKGSAGSSARLGSAKVRLREIHGGTTGYKMRTNGDVEWGESNGDPQSSNIVVDLDDPMRALAGKRYQLCVVDTMGKRHWSDFFVAIDNGPTHIHEFEVAPEAIARVELYPLHEERRFCFEDVKLPSIQTVPAKKLPPMRFAIHGRTGSHVSDQFAPAQAELVAYTGKRFDGISAYTNGQIKLSASDDDLESGSTFVLTVKGLSQQETKIAAYDRGGKELPVNASHQNHAYSGGGMAVYSWYTPLDISSIDSVEFALSNPAAPQ